MTLLIGKYCDEYVYVFVCVSVCLSVRKEISETTRAIFTNLCACCLWPWLGPPAQDRFRLHLLIYTKVGQNSISCY